ncbi:hypothetical protein PAN31108_02583 [Pandoraea anhela]|uniref:Uncharacterized protein n=1 Tax=Pandoraea anhela TaxID=2508295 RepID=A0A5E4VGR8_9BURK|nr:hypothetical protein PAN31108_02583 [Pandoraea anhela]
MLVMLVMLVVLDKSGARMMLGMSTIVASLQWCSRVAIMSGSHE